MNTDRLARLLHDVKGGRLSVAAAVERLRHLPFEDLGFARVDHHRSLRKGFPEIVFCAGKKPAEVARIAKAIASHGQSFLGTRASPDHFEAVRELLPRAAYREAASAIVHPDAKPRGGPAVAVVCAGTSDIPVAEEAAVTAEVLGVPVRRIYDAGVAGLHRLLPHLKDLGRTPAIVVVAGMEGALPSVVAGLVDRPVLAVPTSVGYGASFGGVAALLAMLNSCAAGVAVFNIDNGFGAGYFAAMLARK